MGAITGKLLGIDHGSKVIGVAVSDATGLIARPLTLITRTTREKDFAALLKIISEQNVIGVVVGLPETPEGFTGESQATVAQNWASRLAGQIDLPVYLWEETLSTFEAQEIIAQNNLKRARVDDIAAAVILQSFLDAHREADATLPAPIKGRRRRSPSD
jgi:putative holliday junction resolvase